MQLWPKLILLRGRMEQRASKTRNWGRGTTVHIHRFRMKGHWMVLKSEYIDFDFTKAKRLVIYGIQWPLIHWVTVFAYAFYPQKKVATRDQDSPIFLSVLCLFFYVMMSIGDAAIHWPILLVISMLVVGYVLWLDYAALRIEMYLHRKTNAIQFLGQRLKHTGQEYFILLAVFFFVLILYSGLRSL